MSTPTIEHIDISKFEPRELLFVKYYMQCLSVGQAAKKAGIGTDVMQRQHIQDAIKQAMGKDLMEPGEILARLTLIARADMSDYVDVDESGYARVNLRRAEAGMKMGLIKKIRYDDNNMPQLELFDPMEAMDKLAKIHGMFKERVEIDTRTSIDITLNQTVMKQAMNDPALMEKLGELADVMRTRVRVPALMPVQATVVAQTTV